MVVLSRLITAAACVTVSLAAPLEDLLPRQSPVVNQTTCNGKTYTYEELAGYGVLLSNGRDRFGDTLGGLGSAIALEERSWRKLRNGSYTGTLWSLPDRGWNTEGTLNYNPRVHKFSLLFTPAPNATIENPSPPNLRLTYLTSIKFSGPDGTPATGLDPDFTGNLTFPGFPPLPLATYTGDGFGGEGPGGRRIPIDSEGLVLGLGGTFWVSDEYGPYIYQFSPFGRMLSAIRPPEAVIPRRNDTTSFSAASPPRYDPTRQVVPANPQTGRSNNQGFEGLSISPDGRSLYALLQSAATQEGGESNSARRYARLVEYDVSIIGRPRYMSEHVVPLPLYANRNGNQRVASQSEIHALPARDQFFVLSRDSGAGAAAASTQSLYRHIDVFDIAGATDVRGRNGVDEPAGAIASRAGVLNPDITPATYCSFLDYNVNAQLGRFGLHNGGAQDAGLLSEKWESIALAPVEPGRWNNREVFVFSLADNDFITQDGALKDGQFTYADASGFNVNNQALVFKVRLPN